MGMFDSLYIDCPKCGNNLEFQSKSGYNVMDCYKKTNLPIEVAIGMHKDIVRCQFCNSRIQLICGIPKKVKINLVNKGTRTRFDYNGNYNEKHPHSIKKLNEVRKIFTTKEGEGE